MVFYNNILYIGEHTIYKRMRRVTQMKVKHVYPKSYRSSKERQEAVQRAYRRIVIKLLAGEVKDRSGNAAS
jgi:hypothetical protein